MRRLIVILFFMMVSVWFGMEMTRHPAYALFAYGQWVVEMPLWIVLLS